MIQDPAHVKTQKWKPGDLVVWDNFGVFHRAMPVANPEGKKRVLYRVQVRQTIPIVAA